MYQNIVRNGQRLKHLGMWKSSFKMCKKISQSKRRRILQKIKEEVEIIAYFKTHINYANAQKV